MNKPTIVCVLRSGGDYNASHVEWLAKQVPSLVCLSDTKINGVLTVPLKFNWRGWWAKMELFSNSIEGDLFYLDLDTVIVGNIDDLLNVGKTTVLKDFYKPNRMGSGLMYIAQQDKQRIWDAFKKDPNLHMMTCNNPQKWGDQGFLQDFIGDAQKWQDVLPDQVVSYKVHCQKGLPQSAKVVCFHGQPRPFAVKKSWVPTYI
jgi:hypothetical protein